MAAALAMTGTVTGLFVLHVSQPPAAANTLVSTYRIARPAQRDIRAAGDMIEILRVLHGSRDIDAAF